MSQRDQIVVELKRALRERGLTYAVAAKKLQLSEASVKRLFSTGQLTLERVDALCALAGLELSDLVERLRERATPTKRLTVEQERELIADPKLFLMTWLVINRWQYEDIVKHYRLPEREALRYLIKLDRLRIIELQPGNKARLLISRHFMWRPGGPVQNYIHQRMLTEFLRSSFSEPQEEFFFNGGTISEHALAQLKQAVQNCARECSLILDRDRATAGVKRSGAAFVLALRPWEYSGFAQWARA